jgi:hypothetical protein
MVWLKHYLASDFILVRTMGHLTQKKDNPIKNGTSGHPTTMSNKRTNIMNWRQYGRNGCDLILRHLPVETEECHEKLSQYSQSVNKD